jgi:hypothetical protein
MRPFGVAKYGCERAIECGRGDSSALRGRIQLIQACTGSTYVDLSVILLTRQLHDPLVLSDLIHHFVDSRWESDAPIAPSPSISLLIHVLLDTLIHDSRRGRRLAWRPLPRRYECSRDFTQPELALLLPQDFLDERLILPPLPGVTGLRMNAVDENVNVRVLAVTMCDDDRLVLGETEPVEHAVGHAFHGCAIDAIVRIEA